MNSWRILPGLLLVAILSHRSSAQVIRFVNQSILVAGDCSSWGNACKELEVALGMSAPGDQVWVARGAYRPDGGSGNREATFNLPSGVGVYGGFVGGESDLANRDPAANPTILSGDLLGNDASGFVNQEENSFHVVTISNGTVDTVLDGFTILSGNANGEDLNGRGGGMVIVGGSPLVRNCGFLQNQASFGGAVAGGAATTARFEVCAFVGNAASVHGGALSSIASSSVALSDCALLGNTAGTFGGAVHDETGAPILIDCLLSANVAGSSGGGIYASAGSAATITGSFFTGNTSGSSGGALFLFLQGPATVTDCDFTGNAAADGGAVSVLLSNPMFAGCAFLTNAVSGNGGAVSLAGSVPEFSACQFVGNTAAGSGGAMFNTLGGPRVSGSTFSANFARVGGALFNTDLGNATVEDTSFLANGAEIEGGAAANLMGSSPRFDRCRFVGNNAELGGAIFNRDGSDARLRSCSLIGNAAGSGAGMFNLLSNAVVENCTFSANRALKFVGGMYNSSNSLAVSNGCIFWGNTDSTGDLEIAQLHGGIPSINYCSIQGWSGVLGGIENNGDDPLFMDVDGPDDMLGNNDDDLRLTLGSPALNTGDTAFAAEKGELDLDGLPRVMCRVDRGAYERQFEEGDSDCDGDIDLRDFAMFSWCFTGADGGPVHEGCEAFDADGDGDVDDADVAALLADFAGPSE